MDERILIVEDEAIVLLDIRSRLAGLGYKVVGTASTGEEAITKANATMPDAILMDIGLKGDIDGIAAAASIRKTQDTPIIYLTANSDITTLQRAKITGPFGYVLKPFDERELRVTIEMALYKHRMDRDLYDARQWLNVTLKSIGDSVIASDEAGVVRFMNSAAEALTGWELKDATGKEIGTIFRLEGGERAPQLQWSATVQARDGPAGSGTATLVNREGCRIPIDYKLVPIEDDWGKIIGTVSIFKDITEKVQGAKELTDSQRYLREIMQSLPIPQFVIGPDHKVLYWNRAMERISGFQANKIIGTKDHLKALKIADGESMADLIVDGRLEELIRRYPGGYKKSEVVEGAYETIVHGLFDVDGSSSIRITAAQIKDSEGKVIGAVETIQESADHRAAVQKLLAAEEQIRSLLELSPEAVVTCDRRGSIIKGNHAAASMVGLDRETLPGKDLLNLGIFSWAEAQKVLLLFGKALETDSPVSEEVALLGRDGSPTMKTIKAIPLKSGPEPALLIALKGIGKQ